uniref:Uncharacterized protein n=1 Tax=Plectus sambesii TaxID=2011161 RepID=A0A914XCB1_9BILA
MNVITVAVFLCLLVLLQVQPSLSIGALMSILKSRRNSRQRNSQDVEKSVRLSGVRNFSPFYYSGRSGVNYGNYGAGLYRGYYNGWYYPGGFR